MGQAASVSCTWLGVEKDSIVLLAKKKLVLSKCELPTV